MNEKEEAKRIVERFVNEIYPDSLLGHNASVDNLMLAIQCSVIETDGRIEEVKKFKGYMSRKRVEELRVGNYVQRKSSKLPLKISGFVMDSIHFDRTKKPYFSKVANIKPIPLTKEWLVKFGFINYGNYAPRKVLIKELEHYDMFWDKETPNTITVGFDLDNISVDIDCKYLHQLQNLYHALTETELKIKE